MATLVSPGVSVSVTNESFFFPVSAPTVPVFFVATRAGKTQTDNLTTAAGTLESGVVRTVTSLSQSLELYGVPYFRNDISGNEFHGDARNEYGLLALNQFLGTGNRAFVIRANVDLTDATSTFMKVGSAPIAGTQTYSGVGNGTVTSIVAASTENLETISVIMSSAVAFTVVGSASGIIGTGTLAGVVGSRTANFTSTKVSFTITEGATAFASGDNFQIPLIWQTPTPHFVNPTVVGVGNGTMSTVMPGTAYVAEIWTVTFSDATTFTVTGSVTGPGTPTGGTLAGVVGSRTATYTSSKINFTITEGVTPFSNLDTFTIVAQGNGVMSGITPGTAAVAETWTILMTSPTAFSVTGSVTGPGTPATGTVGTAYSSTKINFTLNAGVAPFIGGESLTLTLSSVTNSNPLGVGDAAKRTTIVTALQAAVNSNTDIRSALYEFNLAACPGYWEVADELAALCVDVKEEAMVIADTPCNMTPDQVAQWSLTTARVSTTNVAYYYPWCLTSNLDGRNVLGAPSGTALRTIAYSDQQAYVWTAPAGVSRGVVTGVSKVGYASGTLGAATTFVEVNLNDGQRDNLYEYGKNINPIVFFPGRGLLIWGQKTSAPAASALDRINVVRLVAYLRRTLRKGAMPFVFEPNDQITRDNLKAAADGMLNDVLTKRGLYDFATLCDTSNNTATRIDNNELWLDVAIKPVKAAEFIYIPIRVVSTGAAI